MTNRKKRDIKTATREENMETNNVVFSIEKVKYTIEKARKNSRIPSEIVEMVQAPYQTYENMKYSADDNAPEVVKDFLAVLENNLMRAKDILEAQMRSKTHEDDGDKKSMLDNFEIINKDFEQTFIYLRSIEKDMMTYYSGKQPKNYGNYES